MKRRRRHPALELRFAAWNAHNAPPKALRRYVREQIAAGHLAIVLTEVWRRHRALRKVARRLGLTMLCETPGDRSRDPIDDRGDMVILLAPGFELDDFDVIALDTEWTVFSTGRRHQPQRILRARGTVAGQEIELLGIHGPTGGNRDASAEFLTTVARVLTTTRPGVLSVAVGDGNVRIREARAWAREHGLHVTGQGPDWIAARGARLRSKALGRGTSDHHAMSHTATPRKKARTS